MQAETPNPAAGGLLTSIASFFLTESELGGQQNQKPVEREGEDTEYEYYEYDDEADTQEDGAIWSNFYYWKLFPYV